MAQFVEARLGTSGMISAKFANPRQILQEIWEDRLGILAFLALSAPFRICKLQIPLAARETDPVSGHHLESTS